MTYVIQVTASREWKIKLKLDEMADGKSFYSAFVPLFEYKRKNQGVWNIFHEVMFPGYVFVVTDDPEAMRIKLRSLPEFAKLIRVDGEYIPITGDEEIYLRKLCGDDMIARMSEGIIEGDKIWVTEGPLIGREASVVKIDRHKRIAYIRIEMFGQMNTVKVGLEIVEKRPSE